MFAGIGSPVHLLILLVIILLLFGAQRIPDLARSLGRGAREFREGISGAAGDEKNEVESRQKAEEEPSVEGAGRDKAPGAEEKAGAARTEQQKS